MKYNKIEREIIEIIHLELNIVEKELDKRDILLQEFCKICEDKAIWDKIGTTYYRAKQLISLKKK